MLCSIEIVINIIICGCQFLNLLLPLVSALQNDSDIVISILFIYLHLINKTFIIIYYKIRLP